MADRDRVLVTGAAGMIGSHLVDSLMDDGLTDVLGVDDLSFGSMENLAAHRESKCFSFFRQDVTERDAIAKLAKGCSTIVHLAARKKISEAQSATEVLTVNTRGTESVLEAARVNGCRMVLGSTSDVYGTSPDIPFREDGDLLLGPSTAKRWAYAVSKLFDEHLAMAYHKEHGVPVVILRYFGGFSWRSKFSWSGGHVPLFIDWILKDEEVVIHGDGNQTRCMGHVADLVSGTTLAMRSPAAAGEILNIGNSEEFSVLECAKLIHRLAMTGKPLRVKHLAPSSVFGDYRDVGRRVPDLSKAARILGFAPQVSFTEALEETIEIRRRQIRPS